MPIYIVMVKDTYRWIDSIWIQEAAALERTEQLTRTSTAMGAAAIHVWTFESKLEDGVLGEKRSPAIEEWVRQEEKKKEG